VQRVADLIDAGALSVTEDREALKRFMRWVEHWDAEEKPILRPLIVDLERRHPAPGVWDIVKFG
jgi:RAB protein geranylgeranyltransferase component A